jgi:hypothetical protein
MTDDEARTITTTLRGNLEANGLSWIARGVDESLRLGKPTVRTIISQGGTEKGIVLEEGHGTEIEEGAKGRKVKVTGVVNYTVREELKMLIDAIDRTVVAVSEMRVETTAALAKVNSGSVPLTEVRFEREQELGPPLGPSEAQPEPLGSLKFSLAMLRRQV